MMCCYLYLILCATGATIVNGLESTTASPDSSEPRTTIGRLQRDMFKDYDSSVRPVKHHTNVSSIRLAAFPTDLSWIAETSNDVYLSFWFFIHWKDEFLTWNVADYDGITEFYTSDSKIWVPQIFVSVPPQSATITSGMNCKVQATGDVDCTMKNHLNGRCDFDLTYFPFDHHQCKIVFQPRSYTGPVLDLDFMNTQGTDLFKFYQSHGAWKMHSLKSVRNMTKYFDSFYTTQLQYTFEVERRSSTYTVTYAAPALVTMMMVLCAFWLDVQCSARVILLGLAILAHMIIMQWLMNAIRSNFETLPVIILLFRDSLLMGGLALVWSVIARSLSSSASSPYWLYSVSSHLNNSSVSKVLLPQDVFTKSSPSGDEDESSLVVHRDCVEQQWRIITVLGDRLLFCTFVFLYMLFFARLTP